MISVIIPTSNEAEYLAPTLAAISGAGADTHLEVVVVDAGSNDRTISLAHEHGARVVRSAVRQRAVQMNLGAQHACGQVLLFLHADTLLPSGAFSKIEIALAKPCVVGGAFTRRYASNSAVLRLTCALASARGRLSGWFLGDQAIFVRSKTFQDLDGFRDFHLFEDLDFSRRLRGAGRVVLLQPPVTSAARRFQHLGPWRTTWSDFVLTCRYLGGVPPNELCDKSCFTEDDD